MIGAGIIGTPFAMVESGLALGVVLLVVLAAASNLACSLLVRASIRTKRLSYQTLMEGALPGCGGFVVALSLFVFDFGAMVAYLVIVGDTLSLVAEGLEWGIARGVTIVVPTLALILPLSMLKDFTHLSHSSLLSLVAVAFIMGILCVATFSSPVRAAFHPGPATLAPVQAIGSNIVGAVGVISFSFVLQDVVPILYQSLSVPRRCVRERSRRGRGERGGGDVVKGRVEAGRVGIFGGLRIAKPRCRITSERTQIHGNG